jgi:hypothetical protein
MLLAGRDQVPWLQTAVTVTVGDSVVSSSEPLTRCRIQCVLMRSGPTLMFIELDDLPYWFGSRPIDGSLKHVLPHPHAACLRAHAVLRKGTLDDEVL